MWMDGFVSSPTRGMVAPQGVRCRGRGKGWMLRSLSSSSRLTSNSGTTGYSSLQTLGPTIVNSSGFRTDGSNVVTAAFVPALRT